MANISWSFVAAGISLVATTAKTIGQIIAASNIREGIKTIQVDLYGGAAGNPPAKIEVLRQSSDGTLSSGTVTKLNESDAETLQVTSKYNCTAEPSTTNVVIDVAYASIVQGRAVFTYPSGKMSVKGGSILGVRVTAPANCTATLRVEGEE